MAAPVVESVMELMRETPLVRLRMGGPASVWAKCEHLLPSGSIKDRVADRAMERSGAKRGDTIVVASSGSSAIALGIAAKLRGVKVVAAMPRSMALEKRSLIRGIGVELVLTDAELGMDGARAAAERIATERGVTRVEIGLEDGAGVGARETLDAFGEAPDVIVIGVGSAATIRAWAEVMHAAGPVRVVAVTAMADGTRLAGLRAPRAVPGADEVRTIDDTRAWDTSRRLAREEGLLVGPSSGACVFVACDIASSLPESARVVTILADTGERYFSIAQTFAAEALT